MKIGIIVPNNLWFCPYVNIYTTLLDNKKVNYDIITWCRDGKNEEGCIQYKNTKQHSNPLLKFVTYYQFASFVKKTVLRNHYDKLIVFTPQIGIFIASFLKKYYSKKYIFDYRDLSIEQMAILRKPFLRLLDNSVANVISSPGFKRYLPVGYNYMLSHNFDIETVRKALNGELSNSPSTSESIDVLTIGGIRDYESNVQVIDALANKPNFTLRFVGKGPSADSLKAHSEEIHASNIYFEGYYPKDKESEYIMNCSFMNIFYPRKASHDTALSNRFYNSLIYKKPMITTAGTTQGDYAQTYGVGLAINSCEELPERLKEFLNSNQLEIYHDNAQKLLASFIDDYENFEAMVNVFINS